MCKCYLQPNVVFIFKIKGDGTNIDLYIRKMYVYVFYSSLTLLGHHIKCIFVHNIYWLENVDFCYSKNFISVIDYIYLYLLIPLNLF